MSFLLFSGRNTVHDYIVYKLQNVNKVWFSAALMVHQITNLEAAFCKSKIKSPQFSAANQFFRRLKFSLHLDSGRTDAVAPCHKHLFSITTGAYLLHLCSAASGLRDGLPKIKRRVRLFFAATLKRCTAASGTNWARKTTKKKNAFLW